MELIQLHFSDSWAIILKSFLEDEKLTNEEIAVVDNRGDVVPMQLGVDAELGELKDVPAPDRFPLRVRKATSKVASLQPVV